MLLGYKKRFRLAIESGIKIHTMRDRRKIEPKIGETLYMYTGLRTAWCQLITDKETLRSTQKCEVLIDLRTRMLQVSIDGRRLGWIEVSEFVVNDGFDDTDDFIEWWLAKLKKKELRETTYLAWSGNLHHWTDHKY